MKVFILIFVLFITPAVIAQYSSLFELEYYSLGLGSSKGSVNKYLFVEGDSLFYYKLDRNEEYTLEEDSIFKDTIRRNGLKSVKLNQGTIDSIITLASNIPTDTVWKFNFCVKSGAVYVMKSTNPKWGVSVIKMMNTFDSTAYKILELLNQYIPVNDKVYYPMRLWELSEDCLENLKKRSKKREQIKGKNED